MNLPIEIINKILLYRETHDVAKLINLYIKEYEYRRCLCVNCRIFDFKTWFFMNSKYMKVINDIILYDY